MRAPSWKPLFIAFAGVLFAAPALAQQRVAVENFPNDKRGAVRAQIAAAFCAQAECVPPSRITTRKRVDWAKVARERVEAVLTGAVTGKGAKQKLSLVLVGSNKQILWRKSLKLSRGKLAPRLVNGTTQELLSAVTAAPAPPPVAATPPPSDELPTPPPPDENRPFFSENAADAGTEAADAGTPAAPPPTGEPATTAEVTEAAENVPEPIPPRIAPIIVAELGGDVLFRNFGYQNLETPNLFGYRATGIVMPSLRVEVYPLAPFLRSGWLSGIGLTGDVAFAVGLRSSLEDGTVFPTRVFRYGFGIKWAIRPIAGSGFNFGPEISYRAWDFEVLPGENGVTIPELPLLAYRSLDVQLALEVPLGSVGTLSAKGGYMPVFSATQLLSPAFFPNGSGSGFNAELALGFFLGTPILELRLTGLFTQYNLSFTEVGASDTYRATGSSDRYLGGRLGLRVRW